MILTGVSRFFAAGYEYDRSSRSLTYTGGRLLSDAGKYTVNINTEMLTIYQGGIPVNHLERLTEGQLTHDNLDANGDARAFLMGDPPEEVMAGLIRINRYGVGENSKPPFVGFGTIYEICNPDTMKTLFQPIILPKVKYLKTSVESVATRENAPVLTPTEYTAQIYPEDKSRRWIWRFEPRETEEEAEAVIKGVFGMDLV